MLEIRKGARTVVSDAMKNFVGSLPADRIEQSLDALAEVVKSGAPGEFVGQNLALMWDAGVRLLTPGNANNPVGALLERVSGKPCSLRNVQLSRCSFVFGGKPAQIPRADFQDGTFTDVVFTNSVLADANFSGVILEGVSFKDADLRRANFTGAMLIEVDFTGAIIQDAIFTSLSGCNGIRTIAGVWEDHEALGYFRFNGGKTDAVSPIAVCRHHPGWAIAEKISRKLCEGTARQRRGLVQRGKAARDPVEAERFLDFLLKRKLIEVKPNRKDLVYPTDKCRPVLKPLYEGDRLDPILHEYFGIG